MLLVQLDGDHHAVTHALGPRIVVGPVRHVRQRPIRIASRLEVHRLRLLVAVKQLLICCLDLRLALRRRVPALRKQVTIAPRLERSIAIIQRLRPCGPRHSNHNGHNRHSLQQIPHSLPTSAHLPQRFHLTCADFFAPKIKMGALSDAHLFITFRCEVRRPTALPAAPAVARWSTAPP